MYTLTPMSWAFTSLGCHARLGLFFKPVQAKPNPFMGGWARVWPWAAHAVHPNRDERKKRDRFAHAKRDLSYTSRWDPKRYRARHRAMDGNLIKAYLSGEEVGGTPKFEQLFTNHLAENVHISKPDPTFFAMMFLGFDNILAMQSIRSEYMIEASYFGWYSKFNAVKALILVNDGGKTSIKTRTIFLKEIPNEAPRLLLRKEFAEMSVQLAEHWLELLLYNKYQEDLRDGIVEEGTTFESYQRPAIDVGHFHECCYSAYDSLKLYAVENKEYHLEELKGEPGTETSRSHFFLKEIFNSVNVKKNRGTNVPNNHELNIKQLQRQFIDFGQDRIILQDTNLLYVESPENILAAYKSIYEADFSVVGDISNVGDFLSVSSKLYTRQTEKMALLDRGSESTKCGYVLGLSMALKHIRDFPPN
uniref:Uncharacterized protein n=1 Tax=Romanomermis culicivorax TaxID=13658 RepID=A0A915IF21_ROMCU